MMVDVNALLQYLLEGDILGFIQAIYVSSFQNADVFYGMVLMLFGAPLYIRTKSLLVMSVLWMLLGTLFLLAIPLVWHLAVFLWIMATGALLYKVVMYLRR